MLKKLELNYVVNKIKYKVTTELPGRMRIKGIYFSLQI